VRPSPPRTARAIYVLILFAARRWFHAVSGQLFGGFKRKARAGGDVARKATPRKSSVSGLLLVLMTGGIAFSGMNLATMFVRSLADALDNRAGREGKIGVGAWTYQVIVQADRHLRRPDARRGPASRKAHPSTAQARPRHDAAGPPETSTTSSPAVEDPHLRSLRSAFQVEAARGEYGAKAPSRIPPRQGDPADTAARQKRLMEAFTESGAEGFYVARRRSPMPWPSVDLWPASENQRAMILALAVMLNLVALTATFMVLGNPGQDLSKVEWSLEWLFTLPARASTIFLAQLLQFALLNVWSWFLSFPLLFVAFWSSGWRGWALPLALVATLYVNVLLASIRLVAETYLRKTFHRGRLKNLQAVFALGSMLCLMELLLLAAVGSGRPALLDALRHQGSWVQWLPFSLPMMLCSSGPGPWAAAGAMAALAVLVPPAAVRAAGWLVREGLVSAAGSDRSTRGPSERIGAFGGVLRGIVGKELRLLARDRSLLVQCFVVPVFVIGIQLVMNRSLVRAIASDFRHASAFAFAVGAYVMMFGGLRVLAAEGKALWLLYTFPRRLERIMLDKALMWSCFGLIYALAVLGYFWARSPAMEPSVFLGSVMAAVGVVIYSFMAAGIGVLGTDPFEAAPQRKIRMGMTYLYLLLAGLYAYGIYVPSAWQKLMVLALCSLVVVAIWQKVRERMPYLLDPTETPPPRISFSDGMVAAFAVFVLQGLAVLLVISALPRGGRTSVPGMLAFIYIAPPLLVCVGMSLILLRRGVPDLLGTVGLRQRNVEAADGVGVRPHMPLGKAALVGLAWGGAASLFGLIFLAARASSPWLQRLSFPREDFTARLLRSYWWWLLAIMVLAIPPLEEYIFRGLLFRGLGRSFRPGVAVVLSAAVFAIMHPPASALPAFVVGVVAAIGFAKVGILLTPIVTHMTFNLIMLLAQRYVS